MSLDEVLSFRLEELRSVARYRDPDSDARVAVRALARHRGVSFLDMSSNDYLGFAALPVVEASVGAGASRLVNGTRPEHQQLEHALAQWLGADAALLFGSGYAANVGILAGLVQPDDVVFSDRLNHASIIDGCRLSRGQICIYNHLDLQDLERQLHDHRGRGRWVVTESYFSMDATSPDLGALTELCVAQGVPLIVDEAHALGVFGSQGRGLCAGLAAPPEVRIGTFGKALGGHGAFVVGSSTLRTWLWNAARSFVFSTATSPALAVSSLDRVQRVRDGDSLRVHLSRLCSLLEEQLTLLAVRTPPGRHGPIFPLLVGDETSAIRLERHLATWGILAPAIRPPTVPVGGSRVRLTLNASTTERDLERLVDALREFFEGAS